MTKNHGLVSASVTFGTRIASRAGFRALHGSKQFTRFHNTQVVIVCENLIVPQGWWDSG